MKKVLLFLLLLLPISVYADNTLYDVLKNEAESNGLAREYTGEHHDSFTEEPTKKIYHWYADNDTDGLSVTEKNNVLFAKHCWQILRTTDTGGVKLIYNGEAENNKCLDTRGNHVGYDKSENQVELLPNYYYGTDYEFDKTNSVFHLSGTITTGEVKERQYTCKLDTHEGTCSVLHYVERKESDNTYRVIKINSNSDYSQIGKTLFYNTGNASSLADFGYMYNQQYLYDGKLASKTMQLYYNYIVNNKSVWYSNSVVWNDSTKEYELVNPTQAYLSSTNVDWVGKYFIIDKKTDSSVLYVASGIDVFASYYFGANIIQLNDGHDLDYYNDSYTVGREYIDNGDGTYTIINSHTYELKNGVDLPIGQFVCKNAVNNTCENLLYITNQGHFLYYYYPVNEKIKYASGFTYNNGQYILNDDSDYFWNQTSDETKNFTKTHRYTCFNESGVCEKIFYVYDYSSYDTVACMELTGGIDITEAMNQMLNNVENIKDSEIKIAIDEWYKKYMFKYSEYLEDTVFCNNRYDTNFDNSAFNPETEGTGTRLIFTRQNDLICNHITDQFSMNNNKARLVYPVGLATYQEMNLINNNIIRKTNSSYYLLTPANFELWIRKHSSIRNDGSINSYDTPDYNGVRPVISLKPNTLYSSGNGSKETPYKIAMNYQVNVEIKNGTEDVTISVDDFTKVEEGKEVPFKITPVKGYQLNSIQILDEEGNEIEYTENNNHEYVFVMPSANVTIIPSYSKVSSSITVEDNKNTKEFVIQVNDVKAVVYEETVRFTIVPEDGYELEDIEITDASGNKIEYHKTNKKNEYEFSMPDSDVTIKPIYKEIPKPNNNSNNTNPKTGRNSLLILGVLLIALLGIKTIKKEAR